MSLYAAAASKANSESDVALFRSYQRSLIVLLSEEGALSHPTYRSDKKTLNAINARAGEGALLYFLPEAGAADPNRRKQRVSSDAEKVFLLASGPPL